MPRVDPKVRHLTTCIWTFQNSCRIDVELQGTRGKQLRRTAAQDFRLHSCILVGLHAVCSTPLLALMPVRECPTAARAVSVSCSLDAFPESCSKTTCVWASREHRHSAKCKRCSCKEEQVIEKESTSTCTNIFPLATRTEQRRSWLRGEGNLYR